MKFKLVVCKDWEDVRKWFDFYLENTSNVLTQNWHNAEIITKTQTIRFHPIVKHNQWRDIQAGQFQIIEFTYAGIDYDAQMAVLSRLRTDPYCKRG